jgi:hypothetical protein
VPGAAPGPAPRPSRAGARAGRVLTPAPTTVPDIVEELRLLYLERALAEIQGLVSDRNYMADLERDIASYRHAYVRAAVTEIATFARRAVWAAERVTGMSTPAPIAAVGPETRHRLAAAEAILVPLASLLVTVALLGAELRVLLVFE